MSVQKTRHLLFEGLLPPLGRCAMPLGPCSHGGRSSKGQGGSAACSSKRSKLEAGIRSGSGLDGGESLRWLLLHVWSCRVEEWVIRTSAFATYIESLKPAVQHESDQKQQGAQAFGSLSMDDAGKYRTFRELHCLICITSLLTMKFAFSVSLLLIFRLLFRLRVVFKLRMLTLLPKHVATSYHMFVSQSCLISS